MRSVIKSACRRGAALFGRSQNATILVPRSRVATLVGGTLVGSVAISATSPSHCWRLQTTNSTLAKVDALFDSNEYATLAKTLRAALSDDVNDAELHWRLARACKKLADTERPKSSAKRALIQEGLACTEKAIALNEACGPAHKWHAILLAESGEFEGTSATIKNSFVVKVGCSLRASDDIAMAIELTPT